MDLNLISACYLVNNSLKHSAAFVKVYFLKPLDHTKAELYSELQLRVLLRNRILVCRLLRIVRGCGLTFLEVIVKCCKSLDLENLRNSIQHTVLDPRPQIVSLEPFSQISFLRFAIHFRNLNYASS